MFEVRCATCKRIEVWDGQPPACAAVSQEGGARRPADHPALAAWRAIDAAGRSGGAVMGSCAGCGQPLVTEAKVAPLPYPLAFAGLRFDGRSFVDASGPVPSDEARRRIEAAVPPPPPLDAGRAFFVGWAGLLGLLGLVFWVAGASYVAFFLVRGAQTGQLWGQRGTGVYQKDIPEDYWE